MSECCAVGGGDAGLMVFTRIARALVDTPPKLDIICEDSADSDKLDT